jgi:hypothetical protein
VILTVRPAVQSDVAFVASRLRPEDKQEIEVLSGAEAQTAIECSHAFSLETYSVRLETPHGRIAEDPAALFGVACAPIEEGLGVIWMVATSEIHRAPISILREAQHWMDHFHRVFPEGLFNIVDARNGLHLRWLWLLGFKELGRHQVRGHEFVHVYRG